MKMKIVGMKSNKGQMDNGTKYDSTKVFVETKLDESKGTAKGVAVTEYPFGLSDEFEKFKHLPMPFMAEVELDMVTSGKATKTIITSITPLEVAKTSVANRAAA